MASDLLKSCTESGVTQLCFIRHANAAPLPGTCPKRVDKPHDWKVEDQRRVLTEKGLKQCDTASLWFSSLPLKGCITSPARRASDTAMNMLGDMGKTIELRMVAPIHPAGVSEACESLFETQGYGPLRKFFSIKEGEPAFRAYAEQVCGDMAKNIAAACGPQGSCVAVFGHAVFLNAIALAAAEKAGASAETVASLLDMDLGETQGILLDLPSGTVAKKTVATDGGAKLINACSAAGVKKVIVVRHANTAPAPDGPKRADEPHHWKKSDQARELTPKGEKQAADAKVGWADGALKGGLIIASPAKRAKGTATLMTGVQEPFIVESVHPAGMSETCELMFEKIGYGKLRTYFEEDKGELAFRDYAGRVCSDVADTIPAASEDAQEKPAESAKSLVAIFGHAVFLNAIALEILLSMDFTAEQAEFLLDVDLGETEGIAVDLTSGKVEKHALQ